MQLAFVIQIAHKGTFKFRASKILFLISSWMNNSFFVCKPPKSSTLRVYTIFLQLLMLTTDKFHWLKLGILILGLLKIFGFRKTTTHFLNIHFRDAVLSQSPKVII